MLLEDGRVDDYATCFSDLPEHVCCCIFSRLTRRQKAATRQSCSRFRKLVNSISTSLVLSEVPATPRRIAEAGFDNLQCLTLSSQAWWSPEVVTALLREVGKSALALESLDLKGCLQLSIEMVEQLQRLPRLRHLNLPDSSPRDDGWQHLSHLSLLTHLTVISSEHTLELATQLRSLKLITPFPPLDSSHAPSLLPHLLHLTSITICLVSTTCPSLQSLLLLPQLYSLHLFSHSVALPLLTLDCWQQICDLPALKQLELDGFVMEHVLPLPGGQVVPAGGQLLPLGGILGVSAGGALGEAAGMGAAGGIMGATGALVPYTGRGYDTARRKRGAHLEHLSVKDCLDPLNLLFPGWMGLHTLCLNECLFSTLQLEQLSNLSQLEGLTRLELLCVWRGSGLLSQWLEGLTPTAVPPHVEELSLKCCGLLGSSLLLGCFRHFRQLRRLDVEENCLLAENFFSCLTQLKSLEQLNQLRVRCSRLNPSVLPYVCCTAAALWPDLHMDLGNVQLEQAGDVKLCLIALSALAPSQRLSLSLQFSHFLDIEDTVTVDIKTLCTITPLTSLSLSFASDYIFQRAAPSLGDLLHLPDLEQLTLLVPPRVMQGAWGVCYPLVCAGVRVQVLTV